MNHIGFGAIHYPNPMNSYGVGPFMSRAPAIPVQSPGHLMLQSPGPKPYKFIGFGAIHEAKPYELIRFGATHGPKPYTFIGCGAMDITKPYEFIGFGTGIAPDLKILCRTP